MKIRIFLFVFFISSSLFSEAFDHEYLINHRWGPDGGGFGLYLSFHEDETYVISFAGEGGNRFVGNFEIVNNTVVLTPTEWLGDIGYFEQFAEVQTYSYYFSETSFINEEGIIGDQGHIFYDLDSGISDSNKSIELNGVNALKIGEKQTATINYNCYVRCGPGTDYEYYIFQLMNQDDFTPFLEIGREIEIWARSIHEETIGEFTGPWYYCDLKLDWYDNMILNNEEPQRYYTNMKVWIYGPLVQVRE